MVNIILQRILSSVPMAYRTRMKYRIKIKSDWSAYENKELDTTQEGLESEIVFLGKNQQISITSHFAKVELLQVVQILEDQIYPME